MSTFDSSAAPVSGEETRDGGGTTPTDAHWSAAAHAVTGQPNELLQVTAVAHAIAQAEIRGGHKAFAAVDVYAVITADEPLAAFLRGARTALDHLGGAFAADAPPDRHTAAQQDGARP